MSEKATCQARRATPSSVSVRKHNQDIVGLKLVLVEIPSNLPSDPLILSRLIVE